MLGRSAVLGVDVHLQCLQCELNLSLQILVWTGHPLLGGNIALGGVIRPLIQELQLLTLRQVRIQRERAARKTSNALRAEGHLRCAEAACVVRS